MIGWADVSSKPVIARHLRCSMPRCSAPCVSSRTADASASKLDSVASPAERPFWKCQDIAPSFFQTPCDASAASRSARRRFCSSSIFPLTSTFMMIDLACTCASLRATRSPLRRSIDASTARCRRNALAASAMASRRKRFASFFAVAAVTSWASRVLTSARTSSVAATSTADGDMMESMVSSRCTRAPHSRSSEHRGRLPQPAAISSAVWPPLSTLFTSAPWSTSHLQSFKCFAQRGAGGLNMAAVPKAFIPSSFNCAGRAPAWSSIFARPMLQ
mmetsp:Transcript_7007/g.22755  ORF Transcript_7007/g.22755 Transcript_7007/m.22755 type:complete len:274 (-) Transcript_7007:618-1439(-)